MRRNGVTHITAAGSSVRSVSRMTICIGTLKPAPPAEARTPSKLSGSAAGPNTAAAIMTAPSRPPPAPATGRAAHSRPASRPPAAPRPPPAPDAGCAVARAPAVPSPASGAPRAAEAPPRLPNRAAAATTAAPRARPTRRPRPSTAPHIPSARAPLPRPGLAARKGSRRLEFVAEIRDPHPQTVLDHHDLSGAAQHAPDVDIDVFAGRPAGRDDTAFFERQYLARRHGAPVELDGDLDRDLAQRCNFFLRIHRRISGSG